jgi:hypothetical protein
MHGIFTPYAWYFYPLPIVYRSPNRGIFYLPLHGILIPLPMVYRTPYPWYVDPYTWYFDPSTHGIANPLPMVCRPPINDILTPLYKKCLPLSLVYLPPTHSISTH